MELQEELNNNLEVLGAREHNLKNIDVVIPRDKLVVITGLSGSGKSSLAFDTIYAEGQRRYLESFSVYARQFIGKLKRPDVDMIRGLSPVISIEQKTTTRSSRSTVGTTTEVYDFLRLLFARASEAFSYNTGEKMIQYTDDQIVDVIFKNYKDQKLTLLAPLVKARKGTYKDLFDQIRRWGFIRVRIDGEITDLSYGISLDRYKTHNIEVVIDRILIKESERQRIRESVKLGLKHGKGTVYILDKESNKEIPFSRKLMCPSTGISYEEPAPNMFSFNSPYGACKKCNGMGMTNFVDLKKIIPDKSQSIASGGLAPLGQQKNSWIFKQVEAIATHYNFSLSAPISSISATAMEVLLNGSDEMLKVKVDSAGSAINYAMNFEGIVTFINRQFKQTDNPGVKKWLYNYMTESKCEACKGSRLKKEALQFKIAGKNIADYSAMNIKFLHDYICDLPEKLNKKQQLIAKEILKEIKYRLKFLLDVGLGYLCLNRQTKTLSGGESQRIRLATQIGTQLTNVLYILDEPSIGLHQRDNNQLINSLKYLRDQGNSVMVVEHDEEMISAADFIVDVGPGAGIHGGKIVAIGSMEDIIKSGTCTANYLSRKKQLIVPRKRRLGNKKNLIIENAAGHNLKNVKLTLPLGLLTCITGVSGSGKSSLINETLYPILAQKLYNSSKNPLQFTGVSGIQHIDKVIEINQAPIGRTPRSNPATYTGVFTDIRELFAGHPQSKIRGYKPGRFSFNVKGGRCETCQGGGLRTIEMKFLPDVYVECNECKGQRYNKETLEVRYKGKSINDVLSLTIEQALDFFNNIPSIIQKIKALDEVGLGYLTMGQPSTTLSGGEAQRVKLASELYKRETGNTIYIMDEPTTGLHFEDINQLMNVVNRLVDKGNTILIIEHNMDVIKMADHVIDMGPEGGDAGGNIISEGTPEEIVKQNNGYTAKFLSKVLKQSAKK